MSNTITNKAPLRQIKDVRELLSNESARNQLASVASKHMNPERMMRVVAAAIRTTPLLQQVEPLSMLGALMNCAALGLEPNTPLGHAYLIPFKNTKKGIVEVQTIIGYKGFADLARRSGQVVSLHADVVYSDDEMWTYEYGSNMHLRHKPGPRKGTKLGAYCHVTLKDGQAFVFLPAEEIIKIREMSQGWRTAKRFGKTADSPWTTHEDRMWSKTAVRALANRGEMPLSIEFMEAMEADDAKVDYAAYAMNPDDGLVIDGEADEIDAGAKQVEDEARTAKADAAPKAVEKPKPETKIEDRKVAQEVEPGYDIDARPEERGSEKAPEAKAAAEHKAEERSDKPAAADVDRKPLEALRDQIINDLNDTGMVDACRDFHTTQGNLQRLKDGAPDLFDEIKAAFAEASSADAA